MQEERYLGLPQLLEARKALGNIAITPEIYAQMGQVVERSPELVARIRGHYDMLDKGERIRPNFPNEMQILYMRDRQMFSFLLFPELMDIGYEVGRLVGEKFIAPYLTGKNLPEIMESNLPIASQHGYAHQELVVLREDFAIYRNYECADCYGMPNIGMKVCCYEAGTAAGCFETPLGKPVTVVETKCCANGDEYCEFEVRVG